MIRFFRTDAPQHAAEMAYAKIVAQARRPDFYEGFGVADTLDGRFDVLVLHAFLFFRRLKGADGRAAEFSQLVFDTMFSDLDHSLREMGVGDMSIGKKVRKMGDAFYGRTKAYDAAMDAHGARPADLVEAIRRNIFPDGPHTDGAERLADYMMRCEAHLAKQETGRLLQGDLDFPAP